MAVFIPAPEPDGVSPSSPGPYTTSVDATLCALEVLARARCSLRRVAAPDGPLISVSSG
jgi:hypothetical protein